MRRALGAFIIATSVLVSAQWPAHAEIPTPGEVTPDGSALGEVTPDGSAPGDSAPEDQVRPARESEPPAPDDGSLRPPPPRLVYTEKQPDNALTLEPLGVVFARAFAVEYERHVTDGWSLFVQPSVVFGASRLTAENEDEVGRGFSGFGLGMSLGARFFPFDRGLEGFFVSAYVSLAWAKATSEADVNHYSFGLGFGAMAGYTFILGGVFDLSLGAGAAYFQVHFDSDRAVEHGVQPAIRAAMGAAF